MYQVTQTNPSDWSISRRSVLGSPNFDTFQDGGHPTGSPRKDAF